MATIEEWRAATKIPEGTVGHLMGSDCVLQVIGRNEAFGPDDVVLRVTNGLEGAGNADVFWVTADGQLHFGPQALKGLTRHVTRELAKAIEKLNWAERELAQSKLAGVYRRELTAEQMQGDVVWVEPVGGTDADQPNIVEAGSENRDTTGRECPES